MIGEMERESIGIFNAVPYDVRLSQMMFEGAGGEPCPFVFNSHRFFKKLPNKADRFSKWWKELASGYDPVKESSVITNMGLMEYEESEVEKYSIVHGKKASNR
eukprot:CAMPEP_0183730982 /NCGR_PEP_ID=MMETSP0737-20130205/34022_1 /TAXON_ID=385413 /ORGANISM="Thalassiosira miniscula, Strain CCMP1093" /LENGTH=102 /DNA_ID=CAMNT_0025963591 /DNA_START=365 /DNA_END=673 /DNA_ORIENTATION=-